MIDLHSHLLPNIDDGSKSLRASLRMANEAVENGIEAALMTPHHMNGHYVNHKADVIQLTSQFQEHLDKENIPLQVFPSQEVRINGGLIEALDNDDILFADEGNRYLLLEFPDDDVPTYSEDMIFKIMQRGISIQIAHPERNTKIMSDPDILYSLIEKGAVAQVTASSYVGSFGKKVQKFAESIIAHNLAHVFVSDANSTVDITPTGTATSVMTADSGNGRGTSLYTMGTTNNADSSVNLEVPGTSTQEADTYTTKLNWTLLDAPK